MLRPAVGTGGLFCLVVVLTFLGALVFVPTGCGGHTYGTPYYQSDTREWHPIDKIPAETRAALVSDLEERRVRLLIPTESGPLHDSPVSAEAWVYWMTVDGNRGAHLMLLVPDGHTYYIDFHVTSRLPFGPPDGWDRVIIRGTEGASWTGTPDGYSSPRTTFSWVEGGFRMELRVNADLLEPSDVLDWLIEWESIP